MRSIYETGPYFNIYIYIYIYICECASPTSIQSGNREMNPDSAE